jgi:deoxyribonucleoside regulator
LTEVATLYYVDRFTQQQIARQIGRSVATVSRLLAEAEAKEIVEVRVRYPIPVVPELQAALVERFGLRLARVVRASPDESHGNLLAQMGDLAARHLATLLVDGSVISVGWGTSI